VTAGKITFSYWFISSFPKFNFQFTIFLIYIIYYVKKKKKKKKKKKNVKKKYI